MGGNGGGSTTTAGGLSVRGEPDGNFLALNAKTGEVLWQFQTGFGADAPPMVYEVDGEEYVAIAAGGNSGAWQRKRRRGVGVLAEGQAGSAVAAARARRRMAGPTGPIADGVDTVQDRRQQRRILLLAGAARGSRRGPR